MTPKIVVVGSIMIDFTCFSPRLPKPGETLVGTKFERKFGGKGANQCITAAKLGGSTALIASLGSDTFAQEYLEILEKENVDTSHMQIQNDKHSGIAQITVAEDGENSIVIVLGANESLTPEHADSAADVIKSANVLLCQFETPLETTLHALKLHRGHGLSIVNGAPALENFDPEILQLCDIFCVNETEAEVTTGIQPVNLSNVQQVADKLLDKGCNAIILTLGPLGAAYASKTNRKVTRIPTIEVHPVDTTGAGDAFLGALAYFKAYHPQLPMDECIRRACVVATQSVLKFGTHASFPTRNDLPIDLFTQIYLLFKTDTTDTCIYYTRKKSRSFMTASFKLVNRKFQASRDYLSVMINLISLLKRSDLLHFENICHKQSRLSRGLSGSQTEKRSVCDEYILTTSYAGGLLNVASHPVALTYARL